MDMIAAIESWTWATGIIGTLIVALLAWLHIRINDIATQLRDDRCSTLQGFNEVKDRIQDVSRDAVAGDAKLYEHISEQYMQKGEASARMETIVTEIRGLSKEIAASAKTIGQAAAQMTEQRERIATIEATCKAHHSSQPS